MRNTKRRSTRSKNKGHSVWGPTAARQRATARGRRKRGEVALKRRTAMVAGLLLFLAGLAAGSVVGVVADRRGLVDQAGLAPTADALSAGLTVAADYALALVGSEQAAPSQEGAATVAAVAASIETLDAASSFEADYEPSLGPRVPAVDPWKDREIADLRLTGATDAESLSLREDRIKPLPFQLLRVVVDETVSAERSSPPDPHSAQAMQLADVNVRSPVDDDAMTEAADGDPAPIPQRSPRKTDRPTLTDLVEAVLKESAKERTIGADGGQLVQSAQREPPTIIANPFYYVTRPAEPLATAGPEASSAPESELAGDDVPSQPEPAQPEPEAVAGLAAVQGPQPGIPGADATPDLDADRSDLATSNEPEIGTVERAGSVAKDLADGGADRSADPEPDLEVVNAVVPEPVDSETVTADATDEPEPEIVTADVNEESELDAVAAGTSEAPKAEFADAGAEFAAIPNAAATGTREAAETWAQDVASSFEPEAADSARVMATLALVNERLAATEDGGAAAKPLGPDVPPSVIHLIYQEPLQEELAAQPPSESEVERVIQEAGLTTGVPDHAANGVRQTWLQNAVRRDAVREGPMIALVIDDLGLNRPKTREAIALPAPMTLSFLTYAKNLELMVSQARVAGHEILVHMPMEPRDKKYDPGPGALRVGMSPGELAARIDWGLSRFAGYVGVNNHMGSKLTSSLPEMALVIKAMKDRGLLFLDSVTAGGSVAESLAERMAVPYAERDLFLDHGDFTYASIRHQLKTLETIAERRGYAIGIGHPHGPTLEALAEWLPSLQERGFTLVPISAIVRHRIEIATTNGNAG